MDTENNIGIKEKYSNKIVVFLENPSIEGMNNLLSELSFFIPDFNLESKNKTKEQKFIERGGFVRGIVLGEVIGSDGVSIRYDKLVRDKIPEYLKTIGCQVTFHIVDESELEQRLKNKVWEEFAEFCEKPSEEELADLEEILLVLVR